MKTLNKILITLASIFALISCEKDGDKIYLQSLGSDELIATTDNVVLTADISQKVVLSFAWKGQDVQISDTTVGTAAKAKNYMEISLSEDFSGQIYSALLSSAFGLIIAIFAWIGYSFLNSRVRALAHDIEWAANDTMLFITRGMPDDENLHMAGKVGDK